MKKMFLALMAVLVLASCGGKKDGGTATVSFNEETVRETADQFFNSILNENSSLTDRIYPNLSKLDSVYSFTNYEIGDIKYESGKGIRVDVDLECVVDKKSAAKHIKAKLYLEKAEEDGTYIIKDSESFAIFDRTNIVYKYGLATGCINELKDVTDVQLSEKIETSNVMYKSRAKEILDELKTNLTIERKNKFLMSTHSSMGDIYEVYYHIENKSKYDLTGIKYAHTFYNVYDQKRVKTKTLKTVKSGEKLVVKLDDTECTGLRSDGCQWDMVPPVENIILNELTTYQGDEYEKYLQEISNTVNE